MTEPVYHKQPHTQDPTKEPPEEGAPLAQGHSPEQAADVAEAIADHKQGVEDEQQALEEHGEVGPRAPGDHAGEDNEPSDDQTTYGPDSPYPSDGSVDDVLAWVNGDRDRAQEAYDAEQQRPTPRTTLVGKLSQMLE
jgi:hypothetical protein